MVRCSVSFKTPPRRRVDRRLLELAPVASMLSKDCDAESYLRGYQEILVKAEEAEVFDRLIDEAQTQDIVLLCWEHTPAACHRRLIADWLRERHQVDVQEATPEPRKADPRGPELNW